VKIASAKRWSIRTTTAKLRRPRPTARRMWSAATASVRPVKGRGDPR
jgi:hypothetical protein